MKIGVIEIYQYHIKIGQSIDAHFRNALVLSKYLGADFICGTQDLERAIKRDDYNVFLLMYATFYAPFVLINRLIDKFPNSRKFVISNEYNMATHCGHFKPYEIITNYEKMPMNNSFVLQHHFLNLNLLFSHPANELTKKKYDCIYYGTYRPDRDSYFKKYLQGDLLMSTSNKNFKRYKQAGCNPKWIQKLDWTEKKETLNLFRYSLYIEDIFTHTTYNFLANRWYEAGFCNVVVFFDINCRNTILKSEIGHFFDQVADYIVDGYDDLQRKIKHCNENFERHLAIQKTWRLSEPLLRSQMLEQFKTIVTTENPVWDKVRRLNEMPKTNREQVIRYYLSFLPPKGTKNILDIGCGRSAPYKGVLSNRCEQYTSFDNREGEKVDVVGDATALPFPDQSYEWGWSSEMIEHIPQDQQQIAVNEMKRVCRNLVVTFPTPKSDSFNGDPSHVEVIASFDDFENHTTKTGRAIFILKRDAK